MLFKNNDLRCFLYRDMLIRLALVAACFLASVAQTAQANETVTVGSKRFTESYILGEIATQRIQKASVGVTHRQGLGNTAILFEALKSGAIDVYPDYSGTLAFELLGLKRVPPLAELNALLDAHQLAVSAPLGFGNSYALAMVASRAQALGITKVSDLARHADLRFGLSQEFLNRKDGWPALRAAYTLAAQPVGLDHGLAYEAIKGGRIDVMDVYTTDAKLGRYGLTVLTDDRAFFPPYEAVLVYRKDMASRSPAAFAALQGMAGAVSGAAMMRMNAAAELNGQPFAQVAADFLSAGDKAETRAAPSRPGWLALLFAPDFWRLTAEHCLLVFGALLMSITVGVPLGV